MNSREKENLLGDAITLHLFKEQIQDLKTTCDKYLAVYSTNYGGPFGHSMGGEKLQGEYYHTPGFPDSDDAINFAKKIEALSKELDPEGSNPNHNVALAMVAYMPWIKTRIHMQKLDFLDNDLLNKLSCISKIYDKFSLLEQAFGYTDFVTLLAECETIIVSEECITLMSMPRENHLLYAPNKTPEQTGGGKLVKNLKEKLAALREAYLDIYIPQTVLDARQQFIRKLKIQTDCFDQILKKGDQSYSYLAKQEVVKEIKAVLDPLNAEAEISHTSIEAVRNLNNTSNRAALLSHTLGLIANAFGLRPSDAYLAYWDKQTKTLDERLAHLNCTQNLGIRM